jgi:nucleoside-diphosphate-sugar epimerase
MSKVWVTNESSSFAKSFSTWCESTGNHEFVNSLEKDEYDYFRQDNKFRTKEIDIFDPTLPTLISRSGAELIIHQLPITPDKSMQYIDHALRSNIEGTQYVIDAAKEVRIPILFVTSRNYGHVMGEYVATQKSDIYDITAQAVEHLLDASDVQHTSLIPPILYGPEYDEGISGLIKTATDNKEQVILNIDPDRSHLFMHVDDFFDAVSIVVEHLDLEEGRVDECVLDMRPKISTPVEDILNKLEAHNFFLSYEFHPEFDDIEDMQSGAENVSDLYDWDPKFDIDSGLTDVIDKIRDRKENDN